jgi:hypothetical protein
MNTYYYSDASNKPVGPLTLDEMQQLARQGVIQADTNVIEHGGSTWTTWAAIRPATTPAPAPVASASDAAPFDSDPLEKVKQAHSAFTSRAKSESGIGVFSLLYGALLVLVEALILPCRVLMRALRDLSTWGQAGALPTSETDLPVLTYQVVVLRALVHLLISVGSVFAAVIYLVSPVFDHNTTILEAILGAISWLLGAYFLNLVVAAFYEIVGISIRLVNYVKKIADRS